MGLPKRRAAGTQQTTAPAAPTIKLGEGLPDAATTFMGGEYQITIHECTQRVSKKGTVSLILNATEAATGKTINLPPIWMGGGNTTNAPTLAENHAAIGYMVEAAGHDPDGKDLAEICTILTGLECWVELGSDQINGRDCNRLGNACSLAEYEAG